MRPTIAALLLLALSGCTMHFIKPGATERDLKHDSVECQAKANIAGGGLFVRGFYQDCMEGAGWERTD